jgi:hypothetical protein
MRLVRHARMGEAVQARAIELLLAALRHRVQALDR